MEKTEKPIYYVIYDNNQFSFTPEIDTKGYTKLFPMGYQITSERYGTYGNKIDSEEYHYKSTNETKARAEYLKLRIEDMEKTGFSYYMPITFKRNIEEYKNLVENHPEQLI